MANALACGACGVVLPDRMALCPSCGGRTGLGRSRRWMRPTAAAVVAALIPTAIVLTRTPRVDPALAKVVEAYPGISRYRADFRGTDVTALVDNKGTVPVDVTLRLRPLDMAGHAGAEILSGPHKRIAPGVTKSIEVSVTTTPIAKWEVEIVDLAPSPP